MTLSPPARALPELPPQADGVDLVWRAPTPADVPAWRALLLAVEAADDPGEVLTEADLADEFAASWLYPEANARFAFEPAAACVAFGWVQCRPQHERTHRINLWGEVHPAWRRRGLGSALLSWLLARGEAAHLELDDDQDALLTVNVDAGRADLRGLVDAAGLELVRSFVEMRCDLGEPRATEPRPAEARPTEPRLASGLPDGLELVRWDSSWDEPARFAHNAAFADHWGSAPMSPEVWQDDGIGERGVRRDLSCLAVDGEEVAGYLLAASYPQEWLTLGWSEAWVKTLGVQRAWRRRGVASALLATALAAFSAEGFDRAALGVDTDSETGAVALYERFGFSSTRRIDTWGRRLPPVGEPPLTA